MQFTSCSNLWYNIEILVPSLSECSWLNKSFVISVFFFKCFVTQIFVQDNNKFHVLKFPFSEPCFQKVLLLPGITFLTLCWSVFVIAVSQLWIVFSCWCYFNSLSNGLLSGKVTSHNFIYCSKYSGKYFYFWLATFNLFAKGCCYKKCM